MASKINMQEQINEMQVKIRSAIEDAKFLKQNMEYDLFKFAIIAFVCVFFAFIILDSTFKTLSLYFNIRKGEKLAKQTFNTPKDENEYLNFESDVNYKKELMKGINKSSDNQNMHLRNAKLEMIASDETKKNISPEEYKLDAEININSIDRGDDEYKYIAPKKHERSFWSSLFVSKDYENI